MCVIHYRQIANHFNSSSSSSVNITATMAVTVVVCVTTGATSRGVHFRSILSAQEKYIPTVFLRISRKSNYEAEHEVLSVTIEIRREEKLGKPSRFRDHSLICHGYAGARRAIQKLDTPLPGVRRRLGRGVSKNPPIGFPRRNLVSPCTKGCKLWPLNGRFLPEFDGGKRPPRTFLFATY